MTRRRPKWIRARVNGDPGWLEVDGRVIAVPALEPAGYRPGEAVVIMPAGEARELKRKAKGARQLVAFLRGWAHQAMHVPAHAEEGRRIAVVADHIEGGKLLPPLAMEAIK